MVVLEGVQQPNHDLHFWDVISEYFSLSYTHVNLSMSQKISQPNPTKSRILRSTVSLGCQIRRRESLMITAGRAASFFDSRAVSTVSFSNVFPETVLCVGSVLFIYFAIAVGIFNIIRSTQLNRKQDKIKI